MIQGTEIKPFTLYSLDTVGCAAKCCFESSSTKIICSIKGPDYTGKILNTTFLIKIQGYEASPCLLAFIQRLLLTNVVLDTYQKACFTYDIEVMESSSNIFSELLNLICYTTCQASIPLKDMFVGAVVGLIGENIILDPTNDQLAKSNVVLSLGYLPSKNKMIHLQIQGKVTNNQIKKMLGLAISGCKTIHNFIQQKITQESK